MSQEYNNLETQEEKEEETQEETQKKKKYRKDESKEYEDQIYTQIDKNFEEEEEKKEEEEDNEKDKSLCKELVPYKVTTLHSIHLNYIIDNELNLIINSNKLRQYSKIIDFNWDNYNETFTDAWKIPLNFINLIYKNLNNEEIFFILISIDTNGQEKSIEKDKKSLKRKIKELNKIDKLNILRNNKSYGMPKINILIYYKSNNNIDFTDFIRNLDYDIKTEDIR